MLIDEVDDHLLAVVALAKCRTSWKKTSGRPERADYPPAILKQRWQFLVYQERNEELLAHIPVWRGDDRFAAVRVAVEISQIGRCIGRDR
jgi:hypothetical protein